MPYVVKKCIWINCPYWTILDGQCHSQGIIRANNTLKMAHGFRCLFMVFPSFSHVFSMFFPCWLRCSHVFPCCSQDFPCFPMFSHVFPMSHVLMLFPTSPGPPGRVHQVRLAAACNAVEFPLAAQLSLNESLRCTGGHRRMRKIRECLFGANQSINQSIFMI